jgi:hypothetical protein
MTQPRVARPTVRFIDEYRSCVTLARAKSESLTPQVFHHRGLRHELLSVCDSEALLRSPDRYIVH